MTLDELKEKTDKLSARKSILSNEVLKLDEKIEKTKGDMADYSKARWILNTIIGETQQSFKEKVESLTTTALQSVFKRKFEFKLIFEEKRNKTTIRPAIFEDGEEFTPKDEMGGSALNIVSFVLQIIFVILEQPQRRRFLILDEPFHWMGNLKEKAGQMMKELSEKLAFQILFVTHDTVLANVADVIYDVEIKNKKSSIKRREY